MGIYPLAITDSPGHAPLPITAAAMEASAAIPATDGASQGGVAEQKSEEEKQAERIKRLITSTVDKAHDVAEKSYVPKATGGRANAAKAKARPGQQRG